MTETGVGSEGSLLESVLSLGWGVWVLTTTPASDPARIKRDYEDAYKKVTSVKRTGTAWPFFLNRRWRRRYQITVEHVSGVSTDHTVYVEATLYRDPVVSEDANGTVQQYSADAV